MTLPALRRFVDRPNLVFKGGVITVVLSCPDCERLLAIATETIVATKSPRTISTWPPKPDHDRTTRADRAAMVNS